LATRCVANRNQLQFAFREITAIFIRKYEWNRRKEDGMAVELKELTQWRDSVEDRLGKLEAARDQHAVQVSHQREHLVSMDEDLSKIQVEFRAQRGMLQALHLTQSEHTTRLTRLEIGQSELRQGQLELRQGQQELRLGQAKVLAGVQTILGLLQSADGNDS
jgi:chromosome segregation ATPase